MSQHTINIPLQTMEGILSKLQSKDSELAFYKEQCTKLQANTAELQPRDVLPQNENKSKRHQLAHTKSEPATSKCENPWFSRAMSDPSPPKKEILISRGTSNPEVFVFPETSGKSHENSSHLQSNPMDLQNDNIPSMSIPFNVKSMVQGSPGVSELYFNNLINELVKTKRCLHTLQVQQKLYNEDKQEMEKMRQELQQLQFNNQRLQRENCGLMKENKDMAEEKVAYIKPSISKNDSFEYESVEEKTSQEVGTQTDTHPDERSMAQEHISSLATQVEELRKHNSVLLKERESFSKGYVLDKFGGVSKENIELKKELAKISESYDQLKNSVKIWSTCLTEEKVRNREMMKTKCTEISKQSEQLGCLRQNYEELLIEKNALEKSLALSANADIQHHLAGSGYQTQYSRSSSCDRSSFNNRNQSGDGRMASGDSNKSSVSARYCSGDRPAPAGSNHSGDIPFMHQKNSGYQGYSVAGVSSLSPQIRSNASDQGVHSFINTNTPLPVNISPNICMPQVSPVPRYPQNNLSTEERAPSNIDPGMLTSPYRYASSKNLPESYRRASNDTEQHQKFSCPNCLQDFQLENTYLVHLAKCIE